MVEKISCFKDRLNEALIYRDMRPVDLAKKTNISESTISQYRSGYAEPKEERLAVIANALDVNPSWLMGLSVSMFSVAFRRRANFMEITETEEKVIESYRKADDLSRQMVHKILNVEVDHGKSN